MIAPLSARHIDCEEAARGANAAQEGSVMRAWKTGLWAASLAIAVACVVPASRAEAQGWSNASLPSPDVSGVVLPIGIAGAVVGVATLTLSVADVVSFAMNTPFDDGWAVVDVVVGGLLTLAGTGALVYFAAIDENVPGIGGLGAGVLALGALNITHGAWSLATNDRPPGLAPAISPIEGGAMASIAGTF